MKDDYDRRSRNVIERANLEERLSAMRLVDVVPAHELPESPCPPLLCGTARVWVPRTPNLLVRSRRDDTRERGMAPFRR